MLDLRSLQAYLDSVSVDAWLVLAVEGVLQHGGNNGYDDVNGSTYRWDSTVPNRERIKEGDVLVVWNKYELIGIGIVRDLFKREITKTRNRCPRCGNTKIKERLTLEPPYRCECRFTFSLPSEEQISVLEYVANYGGSWLPLPDSLDAGGCRNLSSQPKSQQSIRPIDKLNLTKFLRVRLNQAN
jgi:hypothetical protein